MDRESIGFAACWRPALVAVLASLSFAKEIDSLLSGAVARVFAGTAAYGLYYWSALGLQIIELVAAGFVIDTFGLRRVVGIALLLWAAFAAATGLAPNGLAVAILRDIDLVALMTFAAAAALPIATAFAPDRRARIFGLLNVFALAWLVGVPKLAAGWPSGGPGTDGWSKGFLAAAGIGLVLAGLWWRGSRSAAPALLPDRDSAPARLGALLRRPGALGLVLVLCCYTQVFFVMERLVLVHLTGERLLAPEALLRVVTPPLLLFVIAQAATSVWSDRRIGRLDHPGRSRTPFIVAGGIASAAIGAVPWVGLSGLKISLALTAVGMAMYSMIFVVALDVIPRPMIGRLFGIALAATVASLALTFVAVPILNAALSVDARSLDAFFYVAAGAALAGAGIAAAMLGDLRPLAQSSTQADIGAVFT